MSRTLLTTLSATFALAVSGGAALAQDDPDNPNDDIDDTNQPIPEDPDEDTPINPDEEDPAQPDPAQPAPTQAPAQKPVPAPPTPEADRPDTNVYAPSSVTINEVDKDKEKKPVIATPMGMSLSLGAGLFGFTDKSFNNVTNTGGLWDLRFAAGTRNFMSVELAYIGSAQDVNALGLDDNAVLLSNGAEAGVRLNFANFSRFQPFGLQPYVASGVAVRHYSLVNESFNTSNVKANDTVFEVPLAAGLGFRANHFMMDLRGAYRLSFDDELVDTDIGGAEDKSKMDNWNLLLTGGVEF